MVQAAPLYASPSNIMEAPKEQCSHLSGKKIIVAGAGIAGLAFVNSLQALWTERMGDFPVIVQYERDSCRPDITREGYSMSIRSGGISLGMQALKRMKLLDEVLKHSFMRDSDETAHQGIWTLGWTRLVSIHHPAAAALPRSPIRIARLKLRKVLLNGYGACENNVICGVTCLAVRTTNSGISVLLSDGREDSCDFLVVADGATSKLRASLRPLDKLEFAGPVSISGVARFAASPPAPVDKAWGIIPDGRGVSLFVSPLDGENAHWCISYIASAPRIDHHAKASVLLKEARERGMMFGESFSTLVENTDHRTVMILNAMDKRAFVHEAEEGIPPGVVFIGDSNHAVSAFAANGANLALIDGLDLADCLCNSPSLFEAVREYDRRSMPRAQVTLNRSREHIAVLHSTAASWLYHRSVMIAHGRLLSLWFTSKAIGRIVMAASSSCLGLCISFLSASISGNQTISYIVSHFWRYVLAGHTHYTACEKLQ